MRGPLIRRYAPPPGEGYALVPRPDGEKNNESAVITSIPLPVGERVDRQKAETGEGCWPPKDA